MGNNQVLYAYIKDNKEPLRVLTLARKKEGNLVTFAYSINRVAVHESSYSNGKTKVFTKETTVYDNHNRKKAREIASGRLKYAGKSFTVLVGAEESPLLVVLAELVAMDDVPGTVRRLARQALTEGYGRRKERSAEVAELSI